MNLAKLDYKEIKHVLEEWRRVGVTLLFSILKHILRLVEITWF